VAVTKYSNRGKIKRNDIMIYAYCDGRWAAATFALTESDLARIDQVVKKVKLVHEILREMGYQGVEAKEILWWWVRPLGVEVAEYVVARL